VSRESLRIRFEARGEIDSAFEWYFERSPKAADAFLAEVDASLAQIISQPSFSRVNGTQNGHREGLGALDFFTT
jgi:hypothetical protein